MGRSNTTGMKDGPQKNYQNNNYKDPTAKYCERGQSDSHWFVSTAQGQEL